MEPDDGWADHGLGHAATGGLAAGGAVRHLPVGRWAARSAVWGRTQRLHSCTHPLILMRSAGVCLLHTKLTIYFSGHIFLQLDSISQKYLNMSKTINGLRFPPIFRMVTDGIIDTFRLHDIVRLKIKNPVVWVLP